MSSKKQGRPTARSRATSGDQCDLHGWFMSLGSAGSETPGESPLCMHSNSILSLLCWRLRKKITEYVGKCYKVDSLLNDPKPGSLWIAESNTTIGFFSKKNML